MNIEHVLTKGRKMSLIQNSLDPLAETEIDKFVNWLPKYSADSRHHIEVSVDADISRLLKTVKLEAMLPLARLMFMSQNYFPDSFLQDKITNTKKKVADVSDTNEQTTEEESEGQSSLGQLSTALGEAGFVERILRDKQRLRVLLNTCVRTLNADEIFVERDAPCDYVYFMLRGKVAALACGLRAKKHPDGYPVFEHFDEKDIVKTYQKGGVVADLEVIYNDRR